MQTLGKEKYFCQLHKISGYDEVRFVLVSQTLSLWGIEISMLLKSIKTFQIRSFDNLFQTIVIYAKPDSFRVSVGAIIHVFTAFFFLITFIVKRNDAACFAPNNLYQYYVALAIRRNCKKSLKLLGLQFLFLPMTP